MKTSLVIAGLALAPATFAQLSQADVLPVSATPNASAFFDVDGDDDLDLAVTADAPARVDIYRNDGSGNFGLAQNVTTGALSDPRAIAVADFDRDGDSDLAVTLSGTNSVILLRNAGGALTSSTITPTDFDPQQITTFDADDDGDIDIATANRTGDSVSVLLNVGNGVFTSTTIAAGIDVTGIGAGDFNSDLVPDLVCGIDDTNALQILENDGAGGFSLGAVLPLGADMNPEQLVVGDLDFDGRDDIVVAASSASVNAAVIYLQTNPSSFNGPSLPLSGGANPTSVALLDVDVDNDLDIVVANTGSNTIGVLLNTFEGSFLDATTLPVGIDPVHVAVGDIDGNGSTDAAITNAASASITLLTNDNVGSAFDSLGSGIVGVDGFPALDGTGTLVAGTATTLSLNEAAPDAPALLVQSLTDASQPFKGGTLIPAPDALLFLTTSSAGDAFLSGPFPAGLPANTNIYLQVIIQDAAAPFGFSMSNGLRGTTP